MSDLEDLLRRSMEEIRALRRENEILRAKVDVLDLLGLMFHTRPNYSSEGATEDVAWRIEQTLRAMDLKDATNAEVAMKEYRDLVAAACAKPGI